MFLENNISIQKSSVTVFLIFFVQKHKFVPHGSISEMLSLLKSIENTYI